MSENLIIASYIVAGLGRHAYLIYDENVDNDDDVQTTPEDVLIIRGGNAANHGFNPITEPSIIIELQPDVTTSVDWPEAQTASNTQTLDASDWAQMWSFAQTLGDVNDPAAGLYDTDLFYDLLFKNSNSVISTVLSSVGINFTDVLPVGTVASNYPGYNSLISGAGGDSLEGFEGDDIFYDVGGGNDTFYGDDDSALVYEDYSDGHDKVLYEDGVSDILVVHNADHNKLILRNHQVSLTRPA